ncbi:hypothetical protein N0V88_001078 [Collariella sp. IMI 366227]|nr:hypothetical protein N0V88_001078 [Collariella sp. IMI 366227]
MARPALLSKKYEFDGRWAVNVDYYGQEYRVCWQPSHWRFLMHLVVEGHTVRPRAGRHSDHHDLPNLAAFPKVPKATVTHVPHSPEVDAIWARSKVISHGTDGHIRQLIPLTPEDVDEGQPFKLPVVNDIEEYPLVKIAFDDRQRRIIKNEFEILRELNSKGAPVVRVHPEPLVDADGIFGFWMQCLLPLRPAADRKLLGFRTESFPMPFRAYLAEVQEAVKDIHRLGVVHLDLRPWNVMTDQDGKITVIDFGCAQRIGDKIPPGNRQCHTGKVYNARMDEMDMRLCSGPVTNRAMPGLARKIIICAAVDGLVVHPLNSRGKDGQQSAQRSAPLSPVRIKYGDASISTIAKDAAPDLSTLPPNSSFEAYGIVGLVTVFRYSYLISITHREQVAQIRGMPIYVVTEVALTPCTSQQDAAEAIGKTAAALSAREKEESGSGDGDDGASTAASGDETGPETGGGVGGSEEIGDYGDGEVTSETEGPPPALSAVGRRRSVAQDVITRKGSYGRFAQRWFSKSGWAMDQKRTMGLSAEDKPDGGKESANKTAVPTKFSVPSDADGREAAISLLPKLLRTSQILFGSSKTFYFAYDHDITRCMANPKVPETPLTPLHEHVESSYFWNRHIIQPFINAGIDSLALPLMQGFVGQRSFVVDSHPPQVDNDNGKAPKDSLELNDMSLSPSPSSPAATAAKATADMRPSEKRFDITVISRRSVKRAGLRYLRRGIDEDGNVANSVESEQILAPADAAWDPKAKVYSFVQTRGSFPLFFTQSPYSLKPVPVMRHSQDSNYAALRKHFKGLGRRYGEVQVVNLVEKHGVEAPIGEAYEESVKRLNEEIGVKKGRRRGRGGGVGFEWFDFHAVCRGMKFENVSFLLQTLGGTLERYGSSVSVDDKPVAQQKGVLRTNCMDCLDRTNVCQSSFAKHMLDLQLKDQGFDMAAQADQENSWFNTLWADNGDAISKQYASTGAMKGDYTRTRKRNYRGALTDAGLSLTRLFNGMFNDFFLQASIDFLLGNVTSLVFEEFEATMMTKDPAVSMQNMRQQAIELCQKRVIADEAEEFIGGWTLLTPRVPDTVRSASLEEAVLLLTDVALYLCRFDWNLDKVSSFERVDLAHVQKIRFGTYITSTISPAQVDEMRNVGLVVEYKPGVTDVTRVNTRSLSSMSNTPKAHESDEAAKKDEESFSSSSAAAPPTSGIAGFLSRRPQTALPRKIALKALHSQTSAADPIAQNRQDEPGAITRLTEIQQVVLIAAEIERLAAQNQPRLAGKNLAESELIEKGDIISLAEARKNTGLLEQLGHSIKKLVWA